MPFQLPADTVHFTGRNDYITRLRELWPVGRGNTAPGTVVISAVEGMAGVGKTALAVHVAHQFADQFADGVLFLDLHGYTPGTSPVSPENALDHLLRGLDVPGDRIPPGLDTRAALYRTVLARRRVLIVLDNAADEAQLEPLLPGAAGCLVLVTSRRHLAGLDDVVHLALPSLPPAEAAALYRALIADHTHPGDQAIIEDTVALCGWLPLAIRIAAARLRLSRTSTPARLLTELTTKAETGRGLAWLTDGHRAVATALDASYHHLTTEQQHAFRRLGTHPGTEIEDYALAALADTTLDHAQQLLEHLHAANLIEQPRYRRYTMHDLVATYARTLAAQDLTPDRQAALNRLFDHYARMSSTANRLAYPGGADQQVETPVSDAPTPPFTDAHQARGWLDTELDNLLAAAHRAPHEGRADHTSHQATVLHEYLLVRGRYTEAHPLQTRALRHARTIGDRAGEHNALHGLGEIHLWQSRFEQAADAFEQALAIARHTGNRRAEHPSLHGLGHARLCQHRYEEASTHLGQALTIATQSSNRTGEQQTLIRLGDLHRNLSQHEQAIDCYEQALTIATETANPHGELTALHSLGEVHRRQGRYEPAAAYLERALDISRGTGDRTGEEETLIRAGAMHRLAGRYEQAIECYEQVLVIARGSGSRHGEEAALHGIGRVQCLQGRYEAANDNFGRMLAITRETGDLICEQAALSGLGDTHRKRDQLELAANHYQQVLTIAQHNKFRNWQFEAHLGLGRVHHATNTYDDALDHHHTALRLATELNQPTDQARTHNGLAHTMFALGDIGAARQHWQTALAILTNLNLERPDDPDVTTSIIQAQVTKTTIGMTTCT